MAKTTQKPAQTNPPQPVETKPEKEVIDRISIPQEIEAATVIFFDGLWYDLTFKIKGGVLTDKKVGPGDLMRMSIERSVARLVSFAERQREAVGK